MSTSDTFQAQLDDLNARMAMLTLAQRQVLEGKLTGADGAAGTIVALEGGQTSIDVQLGKVLGA